MKCPKCAYERKPTDSSPDYECPSCGIIYAKFKPKADPVSIQPKQPRAPSAVEKMLHTKAGRYTTFAVAGVATFALIASVFSFDAAFIGLLAAFAFAMVNEAIKGSRRAEQQRKLALEKQPFQHCMTCGHDFKHDRNALRGSTTMEVALWILLLWPLALIYSIWRRLGAGKAKIACLVCASNQVVPANSPAAIAHKKALGVSN